MPWSRKYAEFIHKRNDEIDGGMCLQQGIMILPFL